MPRSLIDIFLWKHKGWSVFLLNERGGKMYFQERMFNPTCVGRNYYNQIQTQIDIRSR